MRPGEGSRSDAPAGGRTRRVAVFVDYWWVYSSARQLFGTAQPPAWFGNVAVAALANHLVKRPPSTARRSERTLAGVHIFIRSYDPEVHHGQHERVQRWLAEGAAVDVGPPREQGGVFWQSAVSVALAAAVTEALAAGTCDTAVVFAGDASLAPLLARFAGADVPSPRIELATWVGRDGTVPTTLVAAPGVWCHRLGEATFRHLADDRRPQHAATAKARRAAAAAHRGRPSTAMAAALAAAGVAADATAPLPSPPDGSPAADNNAQRPSAPDASPAAAPRQGEAELPAGKVRRLTHRLFGRGA